VPKPRPAARGDRPGQRPLVPRRPRLQDRGRRRGPQSAATAVGDGVRSPGAGLLGLLEDGLPLPRATLRSRKSRPFG
jgi:hypothetical protein